ARVVLPTAGTSSMSRWPSAGRAVMASLTACGLPSTADPTAPVSRWAYSAKPVVSSGLGASGRGTGGAAVTGGAPRRGSGGSTGGQDVHVVPGVVESGPGVRGVLR